jgi:hypothetical protein
MLVCVARGYNPSLDHAIVTSSTDFRFGGTATAREDDRSNNIKMAA